MARVASAASGAIKKLVGGFSSSVVYSLRRHHKTILG
jgi:hypothetical protein